jgi:hypothetical protein
LNVCGVKDVRQTEIHTAEPLVPDPSDSEVEMAIEKLKRHRSPGIDQIPAELVKAGGQFIQKSINLLILFGIKMNCQNSGRSQSLYLFIRRVIKKTAVIIKAYHFVNYIQNSIQQPSVKVNSICRGNYWGASVWI